MDGVLVTTDAYDGGVAVAPLVTGDALPFAGAGAGTVEGGGINPRRDLQKHAIRDPITSSPPMHIIYYHYFVFRCTIVAKATRYPLFLDSYLFI